MKNNQIAETFLLKAHESFKNANHREALENFNQTIRFATVKSQLIADAFAGRAQIYYEMKQHQKCIENIQNAIQLSVNDENIKKYKKIQNEILGEISSEEYKVQHEKKMSEEFFSLSHDAHKKIPFIAECLDVKENDVYGRYIMTNKDLKPGDIVVVEEPFYKVADLKIRHTRCSVCLKQNLLNLLPCSKCSTGKS
jgi:SET and MYND domain-containing protein 4